MSTGIWKAKIATRIDSARVMLPATWPLRRNTARARKKNTIGMTAASADRPRLPSGL
ncbi:hypothetical protein D9M71_610070 [compost metagenome]|jgi:hypothetical protein